MAVLHVTRGLPASGKTEWAKQWVAEDPDHRVRVNREALRLMMDDGRYIPKVTEQRIVATRNAAILAMLHRGFDVVSDDSNITHRIVRDLARVAHKVGAGWEIHDFTHVPLEECLRRDAERDEPVGEETIRKLHGQLMRPPPSPLPSPADFDKPDRPPQPARATSRPRLRPPMKPTSPAPANSTRAGDH